MTRVPQRREFLLAGLGLTALPGTRAAAAPPNILAREAGALLSAPRRAPFFLYVPFTAVHHPIGEPPVWVEKNLRMEQRRRQYAACVEHMDDAVGRIVAALDKSGRRGGTIIVFSSGNGGVGGPAGKDLLAYPGTYQDGQLGEYPPLRGHKGQVYEGGIRVPAFVNWPGRIRPGRVAAPIHAIDWMPAPARLAGYEPPAGAKWDGADAWPWLAGTGAAAPRDLYWKGPNGRAHALRSGDWKLVAHEGRPGQPGRVDWFHPGEDPHEQKDRSAGEKAVVERLERLLARQRALDDDAVVPRRLAAG